MMKKHIHIYCFCTFMIAGLLSLSSCSSTQEDLQNVIDSNSASLGRILGGG